MDKYDYYIEVTNDIECWMDKDGNLFDLSQFEDREEAAEFLRDELWAEDDITGNGPNGYADEYLCEEFLCHNLDLLIEAMREFDVMHDPFSIRSYIDNHRLARWADCTIRCYILDNAIENALITWEGYGFKYKGE